MLSLVLTLFINVRSCENSVVGVKRNFTKGSVGIQDEVKDV